METPTINIVDCTDYTQCSANNYKQIPLTEAFSFDTPELSFSRYEVLNNQERKIYLDFDGLPETEEGENMPKNFITDFEPYLISTLPENEKENWEPLKCVITKNHDSTSHKGYSSHVIIYNYSININDIKTLLIGFFHTEKGTKYDGYVDLIVYSTLRLFKLPNFIGIPMTNVNNYHRPDPDDNEIEHYIIQYIIGCKCLHPNVRIPRRWIKQANRKQARGGHGSDQNAKFYMALYEKICETYKAINIKESKSYDKDDISRKIDVLLENPDISEHDKNKIRYRKDVFANSPAITESLIKQIAYKYKIEL